ncbi:MAG TPA: ATP-binding protein [Balneolaceae bacterium]
MPKSFKISVKASTAHLARVRDFVAGHAVACGCNDDAVADICLAVDEAYTNIIKHAYKGDSKKSVDIKLGYDDNEFWVSLLDTGGSFDPESYSKPDICKKIKQRKRGGVGVYLIKELMDRVEYKTEDSVNEIRMTKKK